MDLGGVKMVDEGFRRGGIEPDDMDYILQVISNRIRRDIIRVLVKDAPLTYSALMKRVGVDDSGTFGFHIRKMQRLLKKNDMGEYMLNDLGMKTYEILESLMGGKVDEVEKPVEEERTLAEPSTIIISDRLRFDLTEEIARSYQGKGRRIFVSDIVKLVIHPMPRELFEAVVEGISDCISVHAPNDLIDLVRLKSSDVIDVRGYSAESPREVGETFLGEIASDIVSKVLSATTSLASRLLSSKYIGRFGGKKYELIIDEPLSIPDGSRLSIDISGGFVEVKSGEEGRIRVWKTGWRDPEVDIDIKEDVVAIDVEGGKCELIIPEGYIYGVSSDMSGGVLALKIPMLRDINIDLSGGLVRFSSSAESPVNMNISMNGGLVSGGFKLGRFVGESRIGCELNGGALKLGLEVPEDTRIRVDNKVLGGFASIRVDNNSLPNTFVEEGFEGSSSKLMFQGELMGGVLTIDVSRKSVG